MTSINSFPIDTAAALVPKGEKNLSSRGQGLDFKLAYHTEKLDIVLAKQ